MASLRQSLPRTSRNWDRKAGLCRQKIFFAAGSAAADRRRSLLLNMQLTQSASLLTLFRPPRLGFSDEANSDAPNTEKERRHRRPLFGGLGARQGVTAADEK